MTAETASAPARKPKFALPAVAAALLAIVGLAAAAFWLSGAPQPDASADPAGAGKQSIAVLPFTNDSGDSEQDYFADGLSDGLITQLTGLSGLFVIARGSVLPYKGKTVTPQTVARDLGVRYVLEGSVRKSQDRLRISANLVEAETAQQIWAKQFDRRLADIFTVQDEVINEIVGALAVELTSAEAAELTRIPTANLEAYDWFLRAEAQSYYVVDATTPARALAAYDKAIALDPSFADAYAGYARTSAQIWLNRGGPGPVRDGRPQARLRGRRQGAGARSQQCPRLRGARRLPTGRRPPRRCHRLGATSGCAQSRRCRGQGEPRLGAGLFRRAGRSGERSLPRPCA